MSCERETSVFTEMSAPQESDPKKTFRWRASLIHAKYKRVLSETGGGVFALSRTRLSRSLQQATMLVNKNKGVSLCKEKNWTLF